MSFAALVLVALLAGPAAAQLFQREAPQNRAEVTLSFAPVVKKAGPAVVNVYGERRERQARNPIFDDPFFRELFGGRAQRERVQQSVGSGVIVGEDGIVVTNHHVIEGMTEVKVSLADRREFEAEILLRDPKTDLAVLRLKGREKFPALDLGDSEALEVGDIVLAIGNPFGVGQTVTQGIISALARTHVDVSDYQFFIQTDAAINPGNSGGALVDVKGQVIGINTAIYSKSGGSHGIGFAIPANMVKVVVASARAGGKQVARPWFGARLQNVTADMTETLGLDRPAGALVSSVVKASPAEEAGIRAGDVIVAVDGLAVDDPDSFGFRFATRPLGGTSSLSVVRNGRRLVVPLRLASAPETRPREPLTLAGRTPMAGARIANLSPAVAEELSLPVETEGVVITEVDAGSNAQQVGLQKGDIILSVNGTKITGTRQLDELMRGRASTWRISLSRDGQVLTSIFSG
jgi:Do/DeqQ family serine protease